MIGQELCPHCGAKQHAEQPDSHRQSQDVFYECGNSMTFDFGEHGELVNQIDHGGCKNKIDWTNILVEYSEDFDKNAKDIDDRFFGWIEYQFYVNYHGNGWKNKYQGKNCTDKEFLDKYFENKEQYLGNVVDTNNNPAYSQYIENLVSKDYPDWIGPVTMQEIQKYTKEGCEIIIYRVIGSEWDQKHVGGYVVERNPIGGGDQGRDFYDREILDIIIRKESTK